MAKKLADATGADLYEIRPEEPYTKADLNWQDKSSRSSVEMNDKACRPPLADTDADVAGASLIFIGMPQAVVKYMDSKDFEKVDFAKKEIIELYRNDIKNQEEENKIYVGNILENITSELSKHEKSSTFKLTHVDKNARYREYSGPLNWLREAMIVNEARNVTDPSPALTLNMGEKRFKCYLLDTGLLINLSFGDGSYLDNEFYKAILTDKLHINEGMFVENVVAQCLRSNGHKILFYIGYNKKGKPVMEIDFLIRKDRKVIPIEAKSGKTFAIKSLQKFKAKFTNRVGLQYVLHDGDVKRDGEIIYLPYYMATIL